MLNLFNDINEFFADIYSHLLRLTKKLRVGRKYRSSCRDFEQLQLQLEFTLFFLFLERTIVSREIEHLRFYRIKRGTNFIVSSPMGETKGSNIFPGVQAKSREQRNYY